MPEHHPAEALLVEHASGRLPAPLRPLVEAHLGLCPECLDEIAAFAAPGGRLLRETRPEPPSLHCWQALLQRLDQGAPVTGLPRGAPLPAAARAELDGRARALWGTSLLLRGARLVLLGGGAPGAALLALACMPGGRTFPRHTHDGFEHGIVLSGAYRDETGSFAAGDYSVYPPGSTHGPETLAGDPCWVLLCLEAPVHFAGWRGRLQRLARA
jgi:putative transcriptional regulator